MLRKIRIAVALAVITLLTFGFVDFTGTHEPWLQKIQFVPALLSLSAITLVCLIIGTLIFGRLYCSVVCPLGIFQDFFNRLSKTIDKKKKYGYRPERPRLRWGILALLVLAWLFGFTFLVGLVEPYSAYGRIANELFKPVYLLGNNLLAGISEKTGSFRFYRVTISLQSIVSFVVALLTLLVIAYFSYFQGRTWCNTVCPVGTLLGGLSRFSLFRIQIDKDKCNNCSLCSRKCKAYCIDSSNQAIDYSRCVSCFNCIDDCRQKALSYGPVKLKKRTANKEAADPELSKNTGTDTIDESKRQFLKSSLALAALAPIALEAKVSGRKDTRIPISPPGSISHKNLLQHCTSCHLCVSKCPSHVLKPAGLEYGIGGLMQPVMRFDRGYCNYDCNICGQVCPTGAIKPLTVEEKHHTQAGCVVFNVDICVVKVNRTSCGACAEHCPVQAIHMVPFEGGLTIPETEPELCVGCGGCEYICPVDAVHVEGNPVHLEAKAPEDGPTIKTEGFDFGF